MSNSTTRIVRRIAPLQLGKILGVLYGLLSLLFVPFILLATMVPAFAGDREADFALPLGLGFAIVFPFLYAAMGFVGGLLMAALYNVVSKWVGGVELELVEVD